IVLYTSSFSVVRAVGQACRQMRSLFQGYRVPFEERDMALSKDIQEELSERAPGVQPPVVFFNGDLLGDASTVERMHETGKLAALLAPVPRTELGQHGVCGECGDRRFVPCTWCGGDKRSMTAHFGDMVALRCTACNENGLMRCSACASD
ncbi:uncharacterized protein MONBRDRAFT_16956, partial [Monosiga brevicollis MX1]